MVVFIIAESIEPMVLGYSPPDLQMDAKDVVAYSKLSSSNRSFRSS